LILYEPYIPTGIYSYPPGVSDRIQALVDAGDRDGAVALMFRELLEMSDQEIELLRSISSWKVRLAAAHTIARETRAEEEYKFVPERFRELNVSTLLLLGGESPAFMKKATEIVHEALSHSRIVVMPGQQHMAMNSAPQLFTGEVLKFLKK
jgi:pimeloyl-ACP methyl ester carboxylesterase